MIVPKERITYCNYYIIFPRRFTRARENCAGPRFLGHIATMISVIIPTLNDQASLARCFESLISAAVSGLVREVIVADGGSTDDTAIIADATGARFLSASKGRGAQLAAGAEEAKGEWLLFLDPGTALEQGWESEAEHFIERADPEHPCAAAFRFALDDFGGAARRAEMRAAWRCWALGLSYGEQGLLISRRHYRKLGGFRALGAHEDIDMARRIGRRRLVMLQSKAVTSAAYQRRQRETKKPVRSVARLMLFALRVPASFMVRL